MEIEEQSYWIYIISLVAVINGLGIVRLLTALSEYIKKRTNLNIQYYWVYTLSIVFQLLMHLLIWWLFVGLHKIGNLNFLSYLYMLIGPALLFLSTTLMIPDIKDESINLRSEYYSIRKVFFSLLATFYLWAIFIWPVLGYSFAPTVPLLIVFFLIALTLSITDRPKIHATLIIANYAVYIAFIVLFATHLS
ncbi:MAG: hypothetical protein QNL62_04145, partial [Gammaproteobacteria bacterium]|nr:hypothetical protein [Gammaproteobacteria bacterium]